MKTHQIEIPEGKRVSSQIMIGNQRSIVISLEDEPEIRSGWSKGEHYHESEIWMDKLALWPTKELDAAATALSKLMCKRAEIIGDWEPDWSNSGQRKFVIWAMFDQVSVGESTSRSYKLSFKTHKQRKQFFKDNLESLQIAKPLI